MWLGMGFFSWMRLLIRNRFAVGLPYLYIAVVDTFYSLFNSITCFVTKLLYGRRIVRTSIKEAPIFIIGHWRTGTTLLHELLARDDRFTYPNYYQCFSPNNFLLTEPLFTYLFRFLLPSRRPMDNMATGWDRPQEDEFALCNLGLPSPYLTIAFPNRPPQYPEYLDLEKLSPKNLSHWKRSFLRFLKKITFKNPKPIILKSPPHTFRIRVLLELFPEARFIHIVRNPYEVFPSTIHLWKSLYTTHGLQRPNFQGLEEQVFQTFVQLYQKLEKDRTLIHPSRFYELKYEDLVCDPLSQMKLIYEHFKLEDFEKVMPTLKDYLDRVTDYQTNRYELSDETREKITQRWGAIIKQYGYSLQEHEGKAEFQGRRNH
jgi:omega-hydroxy-beta-dihydromenaquinone-9 sulfotransferase